MQRAVHFAALNLQRSETRLKHWEEEAATLNVPAESGDAFHEAALDRIDGGLAELNENDRGAVILRSLQQRSFHDVAQTLGTSEEAAKKRVARALERLRTLLARRGIAVSAAALGAGLSQLPVTAAPATLASTVAATALGVSVPSVGSSAAILKLLAASKAKLAFIGGLAILAGMGVLLWSRYSSNIVAPATISTVPGIPKIKLASVMVDDQDKALKFYTETLGLVKKRDMPVANARWVTVVSPEEPDGAELLLEPTTSFPAARAFQEAIRKAGIPLTQLAVANAKDAYERMTGRGPATSPPAGFDMDSSAGADRTTIGRNPRFLRRFWKPVE